MKRATNLLLGVFVLNDPDGISNLKGQLIHVLSVVFVSSLYSVKDTSWQVLSGGSCKPQSPTISKTQEPPTKCNHIVSYPLAREQTYKNKILEKSSKTTSCPVDSKVLRFLHHEF